MARMSDALARLMPWRARGLPVAEAKASKAHRLVAIEQLGQPVWAPRDYAAFAREGFMQNAIVYRSVRMIAEAAATIPLLLYEGNRELDTHPLLDLVAHPSLDHTSVDFFESWYGYLLVSGNAYVEAVGIDGQLRELHALRPDRMKVIPGADGWPEGYEYTAGGRSVRLAGDVIEGVRNVLHVRLFHPANDYYGMSPIEAAATAIDIHNQAGKWNKALLDNSARPSGALVYASREGQLTDEQFQRLKEELEAGFQGTRGAGRPMLLEGGLDWRPLSLSPKDMDFVEAKNGAAREIALALGVPPMLLGIPGDNTYSNYQEASRSLWRQTVLPLVQRTAKAMSNWLGPAWGGGLELRPDLDAIEALSSERDQLWARLEKASFLDRDEKRWAAGYGASPSGGGGAGLAAKYNADQPRVPAGNSDGGRWTSGDAAAGFVEGRVRVAQVGGTGAPGRSSIRARYPAATPAQEVRLAIAEAHARDAAARARERVPDWRPPASLTSSIEGEIAHAEAVARSAERALAEAQRGTLGGQAGPGPMSEPQSLADVCVPGGALIGRRSRGAGDDVTTVSSQQFEQLLRELSRGATEMPTPPSYSGQWFQRSDGTVIGVRRSEQFGLTIDIVEGGPHPLLAPGLRFHRND